MANVAIGDIVEVIRDSVLVPKGQRGLITEVYGKNYDHTEPFLCIMRLVGGKANGQIVGPRFGAFKQ